MQVSRTLSLILVFVAYHRMMSKDIKNNVLITSKQQVLRSSRSGITLKNKHLQQLL